MTVFKRVRDLVTASLNDLLTRAEDPESMINQMIREMEVSISEARREAASAIALQKLTEKGVERARREEKTWLANAETALRQGREDLARKALDRKSACEESLRELDALLSEQREMAAGLREELRMIEEKAQEARARRETLLMKKRAAMIRQRLADRMEAADRTTAHAQRAAEEVIDGFGAFQKMEEGVDEMSAEAAAKSDLRRDLSEENLKSKFRRLRREGDVERELKELKEKLEK